MNWPPYGMPSLLAQLNQLCHSTDPLNGFFVIKIYLCINIRLRWFVIVTVLKYGFLTGIRWDCFYLLII